MLLHEGRKTPPFGQDNWLYEIKHDGYRLVAGVHDGEVRLNTRNGADATKWFPEIVEGLKSLNGGPHIIDGEVCVLDEIGRSDFNRLQDRARRRRWYDGCDQVVFCAFDLLAHEGRPLIGLPIEARKSTLAALLKSAARSCLYVGHFDADQGATLYSQAVALKL
jgi:bifunctional non-homologous end joining protein LigD